MTKENNSKLIIWAAVALVIGVILGILITNITTTGKAKSALGLDSGRQEANLQEARQDLVLNLLRVNTISNRENPLIITSTNDVDFNVTNSIQMNSGISAINMYANSTEGPKMNLKSHRLSLTGNHIALVDTQGTTAISTDTDGIVKFPNVLTAPHGTGDYACLTIDGSLYRSQTPCNNSVFDIINQSSFYDGTFYEDMSCNDICQNPAIWGQNAPASTCLFAQFKLNDPAYPGQVMPCDFTDTNRSMM